MHIMVKENIKEYKDALETRRKTYKELTKRERWMVNVGSLLILCSIFALIFLVYWVDVMIGAATMLLLMITGSLMVFIGQHLMQSKGIPKFPRLWFSCDEKIFLKIFEALTFLETYLKEKLQPAKYQCLKTLHEAHKLMEEYWMPSEIKVIMKEIGNEIEVFKEKFEHNLVYTLSYGTKKENVQGVYDTMTEFAEYLIDPSKEKLVALNKRTDSLLRSEITRPRFPIVAFLKRYQIHYHAIGICSIFAVASFSALLGIYYGQISGDTAFVVFATIFGPLIAVYFTYVLRRR